VSFSRFAHAASSLLTLFVVNVVAQELVLFVNFFMRHLNCKYTHVSADCFALVERSPFLWCVGPNYYIKKLKSL